MTTHVYWLNAIGPERISGVQLHRICDDESTPKELTFWTPKIDWWPSRIRYYAGEKGFGGMTEKLVHANFEDIVIYESLDDALQAWEKEKAKESA